MGGDTTPPTGFRHRSGAPTEHHEPRGNNAMSTRTKWIIGAVAALFIAAGIAAALEPEPDPPAASVSDAVIEPAADPVEAAPVEDTAPVELDPETEQILWVIQFTPWVETFTAAMFDVSDVADSGDERALIETCDGYVASIDWAEGDRLADIMPPAFDAAEELRILNRSTRRAFNACADGDFEAAADHLTSTSVALEILSFKIESAA